MALRPAARGAAAALVGVGGALLAWVFTASGIAEPLPAGLGPCVPGTCPAAYPDPHNGPVLGRDNGINVFVGGDYAVRQAAAEAEGRVVVLGNFDMAKGVGMPPVYSVGVVGTGSRVPPDNGSAFLRVGGAVRVAAGQRLVAEEGTVRGSVAYAGRSSGTVSPAGAHDKHAVASYRGLREELTSVSSCYAYDRGMPRGATGVAVNQGGKTVFTGDGTSALQVFNVGFDLTAVGGGPQALAFERIPAGATVLVNLTNPPDGDARTVNTLPGKVVGVQREKLLWNFPDAKDVRLVGTGQLDGAVLIGRASSATRVTLPSLNGRFFTAGSLIHESGGGGGGQAFHAYPFEGSLPDCGAGAPRASFSEDDDAKAPRAPAPLSGPGPLPGPATRPGTGGHVAGDGHELARSGPPMSPTMAMGTGLVATGSGLALLVLYRSRTMR